MPECNTPVMQKLVSASYSDDEAQKFFAYKTSKDDIDKIIWYGKELLTRIPQIPYACAMMSALWGGAIRDNTEIPIHVVAGNLTINNKKIFYNDGSTEKISQDFKKSNMMWDGHVWVDFAGMIGDISIFRSAYASPKSSSLYQLIVNEFGVGRGLFLGNPSPNMVYEAKYVLTDGEVSSLVRSLPPMLENWKSKQQKNQPTV